MAISSSTYSGYFKRVYSDSVVTELIPPNALYHKLFPRRSYQKTGESFVVPVELTREMGITHKQSTADSYSLNPSVSSAVKQATVEGASLTHRVTLTYDQLAAALEGAQKGGKAGKEAFVNLTKHSAEKQVRDATYFAEVSMRWGSGSSADDSAGAMDNLGEVETSTQVSSGIYDLKLTQKSWCLALWLAMEGLRLDIRSSAGAQRSADIPTLSAVYPSTYTIRVTGTEAQLANVAAGDHLYYAGTNGTAYQEDIISMSQILSNTGSLFGIDAATYSLWKAHTFDAQDGPLTFNLIQQAEEYAASLGFVGDLVVMTNPKTWTDLMIDEAALVDHVGGAKNVYERGTSKLSFRGQTGSTTIVSDSLMKQGETHVLPREQVCRIGSNDGTFSLGGHELILQVPDSNDFERRYFQNKGLILKTPAFATRIKNIVPTSA